MIRKAEDVTVGQVEKARGGNGVMETYTLLEMDEFCEKGRMFNRAMLSPGSSVGYHIHTGDFETYYILSGEGVYNDNGTEVAVKAGDVLICKEGEGHGLANTGTEDLHFIALILYA